MRDYIEVPTGLAIVVCVLIAVLLGLVIYSAVRHEPPSELPKAPRLHRGLYDPVYVQINEQQFERLIQALEKQPTKENK